MNLTFILLNCLMLFSSHLAAYKYLRESSYSEQLIATFLVYVSQITLSILFLGLVAENLGMLWILLLNGSISLLVIYILRETFNESIHQTQKKILNFSREIFTARDFFLYLFILIFVTQIVLLLIKIYYLPPNNWDVFAYHLHPVAEWTGQNMIPSFIDSPVLRMNRNPMGPKLLHFWFIKLSGDIRWVELPQFFYGLIVALTSYSILIKINVRKLIALRYAILIYFIPQILIQSRTCQDHLVLTGATLMVALYFIDVFYREDSSRILFLALALGLLLGTKISSPQIIIVFFLTLLISKGWHWARVLKFLIENKRSLLAGLLITLLLGGYWYFKSFDIIKSYLGILQKISWFKLFFIGALLLLAVIVSRGLFRKFNAHVFTRKNRTIIAGFVIVILLLVGYGIYTHKDLARPLLLSYKSPAPLIATPAFYEEYPMMKILKSRFLSNILLFPYRIKDIGLYTSYTPDFLESSGFGVQFFGFGLLAYLIMILWCIAKKSFRNNSVGFILSFSVIMLMSYFVYYYTQANYRLFMFFPVFGMILWAFVTKVLNFSKYSLRFLDFLILVMLLFNLSACFFEGNMNGAKWKTLFTIDNPLERTSIKYSTFFNRKLEAWKFIDSYIAPEEPIGYMGYHDSWVFPYFDNQLKRKIHHLPAIPGFRQVEISPDTNRIEFSPTFLKELQHRNIHFIHLNPQGIRHFNKSTKYRIIDNDRFQLVTKNLYYYRW